MPISLFILWSKSDKNLPNFLWGFFFILVSHSWIFDLHPLTWLGFSWIASIFISISILIGCSLTGGALVYLWGLLAKNILFNEDIFKMKNLPLSIKVLLLASCWGIGESILSQTPFFWIGLGEGLVPGDMYLAGLARWIGASGLCVVQLLIGFWLYLIYGKWKRKVYLKRTLLFGILLIAILHFVGGFINPNSRNNDYPVAIWQTNLPTREKNNSNNKFIHEKFIVAQKLALSNNAKFLITPEGTLKNYSHLNQGSEINTLTGGFRNSENGLRSSMLGYEKGQQVYSKYIDKNRLVPLGEKNPRFFNIFSRGLSSLGGLQSGSPSRLFEWKFSPPLAVAICYEISDGLKIRNATNKGAELIISSANLDPYPIKLYDQFLSLARLRSIENKKNNLLVSNTGPSGLVQDDGKIIQMLDFNVEQNGIVFPNFSSEKTFYTKFGDKPILFLFLFLLGLNILWKIN